jgi:hypothetical protein
MKARVPQLVVPALLVAGAVTACSAKSPPADAYVAVTAANDTSSSCNFSGTVALFQIGSDTTDAGGISLNPTRVQNGTDQGGAVSLSCSVKSVGNGQFDIALSAELVTSQVGAGGSMTITGMVDSNGATQTIQGAFSSAGSSYLESDCSITYPTTPPGGPVDPGRIWGKIDCPNAVLQNKTQPGGGAIMCDVSALFVFENCGS